MKRLYIDIDGVILSHIRGDGPMGFVLKDKSDDFIIWATDNFDCYWLTAWSTNGQQKMIKSFLLPHLPKQAKKIKYSVWSDLKTEGIDMTDDQWIWIDDNLLKSEQQKLKETGMLNNFIKINAQNMSMDSTIIELEKRL